MNTTVLFDLDGTLLNSAPGITEGVRYALEKMQMAPLDYATRERFIGPSIRDSFQKYSHVDAETAEKLLVTYREFYATQGLHLAEPYEGIENLLRDMCTAGYELFVATAKPVDYSRIMLDEWNLSQYFKEIVGAGYGPEFESKDAIIGHVKTMASNGKIYMVGDTCYDVIGAHKNNVPAIGVLYGFGDHAELAAAKPEFTLETVEALRTFFL